jgi:hypothetical protein
MIPKSLRLGETVGIMLAAAVIGCYGAPPTTRTLHVTPPIKKAELTNGHLVLYPEPGSRLEQLVDLRVFGALRPGMTPSDARRAAGVPSEAGTTQGREFLKYKSPFGDATIAFRIDESPDVKSQYWTLRARPADGSLANVFRPAVNEVVQAAGKPEVVSIMAPTRLQPLVHAYLHEDRVDELEWFKE